MLTKKIIVASFLVFTLIITPQTLAFYNASRAAERQERREERISTLQEKVTQRVEQNIERLKTRSYQEIDRRITALNGLLTKIEAMKKIVEEQKTILKTQINEQITALQTLRAKIEADTDLTTLKADKKSIVDSYRIFALFMPKINILAHADRILTVADEMLTLTSDTNAQSKINSAKTEAQKAIDTVTPLTPSDYPGNKSSLQAARQNLVNALNYLKEARLLIKPEPTK
jgi:hypothetical protein